MIIKNVLDSTIKVCQCGSWLNHWQKVSRQHIRMCVVPTCTKQDMVGSHVQKVDSEDQEIYIIPLCKDHSKSKEPMEIFDDILFVSADVKQVCLTNAATMLKDGER